MVLAPVTSDTIFHQSGKFVDCPPLLQIVHAWDCLFFCTAISSISLWLLTGLLLKRCGKCQYLCIPWVHFAPLISTRDVCVQLLHRHEERSWSNVGIVAISCIHITLDGLHSSIEIGIWDRQDCIQNVAPVCLSAISRTSMKMAMRMMLRHTGATYWMHSCLAQMPISILE